MKRILLTITFLLAVLALTSACAARSYAPVGETTARTRDPQARAIIRSGSLELRASNLQQTKLEVEKIVAREQGWTQSWSISDSRRLRMTLRVPEPQLDRILDELGTLGKVISRGLSSRDVTEELIDHQARLENLIALRDRLRSYLDQASSLSEILEVERELARVQAEIDAIEAKLKLLRDQVSMSVIEFYARKKRF